MLAPSLQKYVKTVTIRTCVGLYDQLKQTNPKLYQHGRSDGVELTVKCLDTGRIDKKNMNGSVIVAIHGLADSFQTFTKMFEHFHQQNVRIVAPNMPDFSHTRQTDYVFWHSTIEKYFFLKDLLLALNVERIDCLIAHSFGCQTIAALWEKPENIKIDSIMLSAPQPAWDSYNNFSLRLAKFLLNLKSPIGTKVLQKFHLWKAPGIELKLSNADQLFLYGSVVFDRNTPADFKRRIQLLSQMKMPGVLMFGSNEKLISPLTQRKLHKALNIENAKLVYRRDYRLRDPLPSDRFLAFNILDAGHFPHAKYPELTNFLIDRLMKLNK